jgi:hypothetical protein
MDLAQTTVRFLRHEAPSLRDLRFYSPSTLEVTVFILFNDERGWPVKDTAWLDCKAVRAQ